MDRRVVLIAMVLAALHCGLSLWFATITPYLQAGFSQGQSLPDIGAPDEFAHIAYVRSIFDGRGLPVLSPGSSDGYEAHQPPLYYVMAAGWAKALGVTNVDRREAALRLRSLNALFGFGIVVASFYFALWSTGDRRKALFTTAVVAFLPMLLAIDGAVGNDPLTILICTWTLALLVRYRNRWSWKRAACLGLLTGLCFLAKATGLLLVIPVLLALYLDTRSVALPSTAAAVIAAVSLPWLVRNEIVYGHPLAMNAFYATFHRQVWPSQVFSGLRPLAHWLYVLGSGTALSFVGLFGYMDIHLPYAIYLPVLALIVLGLLRCSREENRKVVMLPVALFLAFLVASYIAYNLWQVQPQARYLFPALAPIALVVVLGLTRSQKYLPAVLAALLVVADGYALSTLPREFRDRTEPISNGVRSSLPGSRTA